MVSLYWFNAAGLRRRLIYSSTCTHKKATQFGLQRFDQRTKLDLLTIVNILCMGFLVVRVHFFLAFVAFDPMAIASFTSTGFGRHNSWFVLQSYWWFYIFFTHQALSCNVALDYWIYTRQSPCLLESQGHYLTLIMQSALQSVYLFTLKV